MRRLILLLPLLAAACVAPAPKEPSGAEDFAGFCASCHGSDGRGNGALASRLVVHPADLTRLSADNAGRFPATRVMAKIWGTGAAPDGHAVMPEFGALLDSELVAYDGGDGLQTPTPLRLVQIAEYLRQIQS